MFELFQHHTNQKSKEFVLGTFVVAFFSLGKSPVDVGETFWIKTISRFRPCYIVKLMQMVLSCHP